MKEHLLEVDEFELVVQINGKVRGKTMINKDLDQNAIELQVKSIENVAINLENNEIKKIIYIKEKIINFVI